MKAGNRWVIAIAGVFLQIALGAVYAWSVFRIPLSKQFGWSISQVTFTFTISIFVLGFAAFFGGLWMNRVGPRTVALTAGTFYGLGVFLASFSANKLWWLYLSYGVIGGIGLGLGYIVPVATLVKWFSDRRGLITGIAVGGFGAGHHRARGGAIDSNGWCVADLRLPRGCLFHRHDHRQLVHAKPSRRLATSGMDAERKRDCAACYARFRAFRSSQGLAMVGALADSLSQHVGWHCHYFPGSAHF